MDGDLEKRAWVRQFPSGEPLKDSLARLVDEDHDEAETEFDAIERARRRYRGMFRRRLRHRDPGNG